MQDWPRPDELLAAVARFLRDEAGPALAGAATAPAASQAALAYQARVAANMLDIVRRQARLAPAAEAAELARLQALLGPAQAAPGGAEKARQAHQADLANQADLAALNQRLANAIAAGTLTLATPGLADHLWRITLDKLAVDQPGYDTYRRHAPRDDPPPPSGTPR